MTQDKAMTAKQIPYDCCVCGKHYPDRKTAAIHVSKRHTHGRVEPCPNTISEVRR